jgi:histidine triad (HIT) family protein
MEDCVFCKVIGGTLPSKKVLEEDDLVAFHDINPAAPVHVLVVPKKHISRLADAGSEDAVVLGHLQLAAAKAAGIMGVADAFRVTIANGKGAGQSVFHIHYHVLGGWKNGPPPMEAIPNREGGNK